MPTDRSTATPTSASSRRSRGSESPTTLAGSPSMPSTNEPPRPSIVNAPATAAVRRWRRTRRSRRRWGGRSAPSVDATARASDGRRASTQCPVCSTPTRPRISCQRRTASAASAGLPSVRPSRSSTESQPRTTASASSTSRGDGARLAPGERERHVASGGPVTSSSSTPLTTTSGRRLPPAASRAAPASRRPGRAASPAAPGQRGNPDARHASGPRDERGADVAAPRPPLAAVLVAAAAAAGAGGGHGRDDGDDGGELLGRRVAPDDAQQRSGGLASPSSAPVTAGCSRASWAAGSRAWCAAPAAPATIWPRVSRRLDHRVDVAALGGDVRVERACPRSPR